MLSVLRGSPGEEVWAAHSLERDEQERERRNVRPRQEDRGALGHDQVGRESGAVVDSPPTVRGSGSRVGRRDAQVSVLGEAL